VSTASEIPAPSPNGVELWGELEGLTNLNLFNQRAEKFCPHPLGLEDVLNARTAPKGRA
jgi:hypothetical protein